MAFCTEVLENRPCLGYDKHHAHPPDNCWLVLAGTPCSVCQEWEVAVPNDEKETVGTGDSHRSAPDRHESIGSRRQVHRTKGQPSSGRGGQ